MFEAVDVITLIKGGVYDDLTLTVGDALLKRSDVRSSFQQKKNHLLIMHSGISRHIHLLDA